MVKKFKSETIDDRSITIYRMRFGSIHPTKSPRPQLSLGSIAAVTGYSIAHISRMIQRAIQMQIKSDGSIEVDTKTPEIQTQISRKSWLDLDPKLIENIASKETLIS